MFFSIHDYESNPSRDYPSSPSFLLPAVPAKFRSPSLLRRPVQQQATTPPPSPLFFPLSGSFTCRVFCRSNETAGAAVVLLLSVVARRRIVLSSHIPSALGHCGEPLLYCFFIFSVIEYSDLFRYVLGIPARSSHHRPPYPWWQVVVG